MKLHDFVDCCVERFGQNLTPIMTMTRKGPTIVDPKAGIRKKVRSKMDSLCRELRNPEVRQKAKEKFLAKRKEKRALTSSAPAPPPSPPSPSPSTSTSTSTSVLESSSSPLNMKPFQKILGGLFLVAFPEKSLMSMEANLHTKGLSQF